MVKAETFRKLDGAAERLSAVTDALQKLNSPALEWAKTLNEAAELLGGIELTQLAPAERAHLRSFLSYLAAQTSAAKTLLDSAAALYFGRVLSHCSFDGGYLADGASNTFGGGCLQIHG